MHVVDPVVKHTHVVDPNRLTHIHSHRDLNSFVVIHGEYIPPGTHDVNLFEDHTTCTPDSTRHHLELQRYHFSEVETGGADCASNSRSLLNISRFSIAFSDT